jgi:hypothetical protein
MALTLLLNFRAKLSHSEAAESRREATRVSKIIDQSIASKHTNFLYLRRLKSAYEREFGRYDTHVVTSLPSNPTEMILQAKGARRGSPDYNLVLTLIQAKTMYETSRNTGDGKVEETTMSKLLEFGAAAKMQESLQMLDNLHLPHSERKFCGFVADHLCPALDKFDGTKTERYRSLIAISQLPRALPEYSLQSTVHRVGLVGVNEIGVAVAEALALLGIHLAHESMTKSPHENGNSPETIVGAALELPSTFGAKRENVQREVLDEVLKADQECGQTMDSLEQKLGPASVRSEYR